MYVRTNLKAGQCKGKPEASPPKPAPKPVTSPPKVKRK